MAKPLLLTGILPYTFADALNLASLILPPLIVEPFDVALNIVPDVFVCSFVCI